MTALPGAVPLSSPRVADLMQRTLPAVAPTAPVRSVVLRMETLGWRYVLVVAEGRLVGLVGRRLLLRHLVRTHLSRLPDVPVATLAVTDVVTVAPELPATEALRLMARHRVGVLPVLADGQPVGVLTETHLLGVASAVLASFS